MLVKRGTTADRPWGRLLADLASEQVTGELEVMAEGKRHAIMFEAGMITSAISPAAADSIGRIALTSHLVSSTQVAEIMRRIAASPARDELELIVEVARLTTEQRDLLRRRLVVQRAARTFAIEQGAYAFDDKSGETAPRGDAIDVRCVIYLGARMHVSETRLANELRALGSRFAIRLDATPELAKFEFTDAEQPILDALRSGTSVAELEATHRELDPRVIAAAIYALVTSGVCAESAGRLKRALSAAEPAVARTLSPAPLVNARVASKDLPQPVVSRTMTPPAVSRTMTPQPAVSRTMTPQPTVSRTVTPPVVSRTVTPPAVSRTMTPQPAVSRTMTPVSRTAVGSSTSHQQAVPPVAVPRTMTPPPLRAPTADVALPRTATGNPLVARTPTKDRTPEWNEGRDAFQRGEMAMRRDQVAQAIVDFARAVELQPQNADYIAMLAWAQFCVAIDKRAIAAETRKTLDTAIKSSDEAITPWLCLGRVERMLGRDAEALKSFHRVLELQPHNTAAASEVRVLEARLRR